MAMFLLVVASACDVGDWVDAWHGDGLLVRVHEHDPVTELHLEVDMERPVSTTLLHADLPIAVYFSGFVHGTGWILDKAFRDCSYPNDAGVSSCPATVWPGTGAPEGQCPVNMTDAEFLHDMHPQFKMPACWVNGTDAAATAMRLQRAWLEALEEHPEWRSFPSEQFYCTCMGSYNQVQAQWAQPDIAAVFWVNRSYAAPLAQPIAGHDRLPTSAEARATAHATERQFQAQFGRRLPVVELRTTSECYDLQPYRARLQAPQRNPLLFCEDEASAVVV